MVAGAWMAGLRGCVMMQTSGFGVIPNALASLIVPYQIPAILVVSERGTMGEFNIGQTMVTRTMRPVLDSLAVDAPHTDRRSTMRFIVDRSIKQALATQSPVAFILSPLLTGGNLAGGAKLNRRGHRGAIRCNRIAMQGDEPRRSDQAARRQAQARRGRDRRHRQHQFRSFRAGHRPQNFYMLGSMGLACPIALGVALAQPQRGVIALEGDGSILMALGCLATIGRSSRATSPSSSWTTASTRSPAISRPRRRHRRHRGDRARRRHREQLLGARRGAFRGADRAAVRGRRPGADRGRIDDSPARRRPCAIRP